MVGYLLKNTVTAYGTVSRGVCHVKNGCLSDIRETLKIALLPDGHDPGRGQRRDAGGDTVVSMNFWGSCRPSSTSWSVFLRFPPQRRGQTQGGVPATQPGGASAGAGQAHCVRAGVQDRWFGMTYHEDRARVARD